MTNFIKSHYAGGFRILLGGVPCRVSYLPQHEGGRELMRQSSREMCLPLPPRGRKDFAKWEREQLAAYRDAEKLGDRSIDAVVMTDREQIAAPVVDVEPIAVEPVRPERITYRPPSRPMARRAAISGAMRTIHYYRVSTEKQGKSGLGLEAQRHAVEAHCAGRGCEMMGEYVEVESGKRNKRPQLLAALHHAKVTGSTLLIAKLDRLSRNVAFLATLQETGVKFVAVDMPEANELTLHIMAAMAQAEAKATSVRTIDALAAARARGTKLGSPDPIAALSKAWAKGNGAAVETVRENAAARAADVLPIIRSIQGEGFTSLRQIARELNQRGIVTARGGEWGPSIVRDIIKRSETA